MSLVVIRPDRHVIKETDAARLFRRLLKFEDLFTYWNSETGEWILSYWINKLARVADEVEDLGPAMERVTPALVTQIVQCWKPVDWKAKKRRMEARQCDFKKGEDEKIIQDQERWDWAKRRIRGKAPIPFGFYGSIK